MSLPEVQKPAETQEAPPESEITAAELGKEAEKKAQENEGLREMAMLKAELPPEQQTCGLEVLKGYLISVVASLKEKKLPLTILKEKPEMLVYLARANTLPLQEDQRNALYNFERLLAGHGKTADHLRDPNLWSGMLGEAVKVSKDPLAQWKEWNEDSPVLTKMVTAGAVVLGAGLLYKGLKALLDSKDKADKTPEEEKFWTKKKIIGVGVAGLFASVIFGRDHLVDFGKWLTKDEKIPTTEEKTTGQSEIAAFKPPEASERFKPSNTAIIGDSIANGLAIKLSLNKTKDFIGGDGRTSAQVLANVQEDRKKLEGKQVAVINVGGNDIAQDKSTPGEIANNIKKIVKECRDAGVKKIVLLTRFPYDARLKIKWGENFDLRKNKGKALRDLLLKMEMQGYLEGVKIVDLYEPFADEQGLLKKEYMAPKPPDFLHPWNAYSKGLSLIEDRVGKEDFVRRSSPPALS